MHGWYTLFRRALLGLLACLGISSCALNNNSTLKMITPYEQEADIDHIWPYCATDGCPTPAGHRHIGLDFFTVADRKPFRAVADGMVTSVDYFWNQANSTYIVNVVVHYCHNWKYAYSLGFESFADNEEDGQRQLAAILVQEGDKVSKGQLVGYLLIFHPSAHMHFAASHDGSQPCPEPWFEEEARDSIVRIISRTPGVDSMCYE